MSSPAVKVRERSGILVLGIGELGNAVLVSLSTHAQRSLLEIPITALVSPKSTLSNPSLSPPKMALLQHLVLDLSISLLPHDLHNSTQAGLAGVFAHYHTVISCTGMQGPPGLQTKITEAALAAEVPYFIPWQFGVDYDIIGRGSAQDLFTEQLGVRAMLRSQSKTQWNIVSTGVFMSFLFERSFGVVDWDRGTGRPGSLTVRAMGDCAYEITATTVEDIGRCVAELVFLPDSRKEADGGGVIFLAGDTLTYSALAAVLEEVQQNPIRRELWSLEYLQNELRKDPGNGLIKYRCVWAEGRGVAWDKGKSFNATRQIKVESIKDYASKLRPFN